MRRSLGWAALISVLAVLPVEAASKRRSKPATTLEPQAVNEAAPPGRLGRGLDPLALKTAILLDRARFSPGVVDGRGGVRLSNAIKAFKAAHGLGERGLLDAETWATLSSSSPEPALVEYVIKADDLKGPFLDTIPPKMEEMQGLKALSYTSPLEMLAERHHMSEALLLLLNRGKDLGQVGTTITVANVAPIANVGPVAKAAPAPDPAAKAGPVAPSGPVAPAARAANAGPAANAVAGAPVSPAAPNPKAATGANAAAVADARGPNAAPDPRVAAGANGAPVASAAPATADVAGRGAKGKAARIEVNKAARSLVALDADGKVLGYYPASVGSREKPAPSGAHEVRAVAENPTYTYNPDYAFKGVKADKKFDIAGGPNNPVGSTWIDLSIESYGIHGTPEPEKVGRSYSHGCVRLTNWDARELAGMVRRGTVVEFKE